MTDSVRIFGAFLYGLCCALLALACEYAGQISLHVGQGLMYAADRLGEHALQVMPEE